MISREPWFRRALRDWRVWALTFTIQLPAARAIVRYAPWPGAVLPLSLVASIALYGACLHGALAEFLRRSGSSRTAIITAVCLVAALNLALYPRADAMKAHGRGSDEDDALIQTAHRLITGQRPLYVPTYLGNPPSVGPGWAALVSPLAEIGGYALLTPLALGVLAWTARLAGDGGGATLALLLPLTSAGFWELTVTGSDLFAVGVLFVVLTKLSWAGWRPWSPKSLGVVALTIAGASSRIPFAWVTACVSLFMWRKGRGGTGVVLGTTALVVAAEAWWLPQSAGTPWSLIPKLTGLLGGLGTVLAAAAAFASAGWAIACLDDGISSWWCGLWALLAAPLAVVGIGVLTALDWNIADWQAASYLEAAVPALVACVAASATPRGAGVP